MYVEKRYIGGVYMITIHNTVRHDDCVNFTINGHLSLKVGHISNIHKHSALPTCSLHCTEYEEKKWHSHR